jgi:hypothetical protein
MHTRNIATNASPSNLLLLTGPAIIVQCALAVRVKTCDQIQSKLTAIAFKHRVLVGCAGRKGNGGEQKGYHDPIGERCSLRSRASLLLLFLDDQGHDGLTACTKEEDKEELNCD